MAGFKVGLLNPVLFLGVTNRPFVGPSRHFVLVGFLICILCWHVHLELIGIVIFGKSEEQLSSTDCWLGLSYLVKVKNSSPPLTVGQVHNWQTVD